MSDIDPDETPPSTATVNAARFGSESLASRGTRLGAAIIDGVLSLIVTLPFMIATGYFAKVTVGETPIGQMILLQILAFGVYLRLI